MSIKIWKLSNMYPLPIGLKKDEADSQTVAWKVA